MEVGGGDPPASAPADDGGQSVYTPPLLSLAHSPKLVAAQIWQKYSFRVSQTQEQSLGTLNACVRAVQSICNLQVKQTDPVMGCRDTCWNYSLLIPMLNTVLNF